MLDLSFEQPEWIQGIWGILILGIVIGILEVRRKGHSEDFVEQPMQARLARSSSLRNRVTAYLLGLAALVCFLLALMRPQYGFEEKKVPHVGAQIMICLDVSKSMLAEDASPNRLERAKSELEVLLNYLQGDQVGLIAFAGKALVMSPMTTDFGYLKMVMRDTNCESIGRGGTSLEAPIRRAAAGFADNDGMSKVILLITDGEDNGSKPLDAAREAAEQGVRIIAVGFGHERGSKIEITDPSTGLRSYIQDANGRDVVSRLDLDMLKELALITNGVMIPARIGSLDVESIHQQHLKPLMRSAAETRLIVRNEAFQWPLAIGIMLTLASILVANPLAFSTMTFGDWLLSRPTAKLMPLLILLCVNEGIMAQGIQPNPTSSSAASPNSVQRKGEENDKDKSQGLGSEFSSKNQDNRIPEDPLDCYNLSLSLLQSDDEYAEQLLEEARKNAGENASLRFRSSYNLGWVKVNQANRNLEEQPTEALRHLNSAADWFRESVRLRPKSEAARQNLEIILKRIAELSDSLNKADPKKFEQQLDQLIQRQTTLVKRARRLIQRVQNSKSGSETEEIRKMFRLASVDQRLLNSDLQETSMMASQSVEEFQKNQSTGQQPAPGNPGGTGDAEEQLRIAQMKQALVYVNRASQRLGQARSQLRLRNAARASLRSVLGLDELKRARDQMRDPGDILRQIMADSELLRQQTLALISGKNRLAAFLGTQTNLPKWLTNEFLIQSQTTQMERTQELSSVLQAIQESGASQVDDKGSNQQLEYLRRAGVLVTDGASLFQQARDQLNKNRMQSAESFQGDGIAKLREAYEYFADLKGLIELTYQAHVATDSQLPNARNLSGDVLAQVADSFQRSTIKNSERLARIIDKIEQQIDENQQQSANGTSASGSSAASPNAEGSDKASLDDERKRLEYASRLANDITNINDQISATFKQIAQRPSDEADWMKLESQSGTMEKKLAELRRLFYSIVEHLRETALRQQQLNSDTDQQLSKLPMDNDQSEANNNQTGSTEAFSERINPLGSRQSELSDISDKIGQGLQEMSESINQQVQPGGQDNQSEKTMMQKYEKASELVREGKAKMDNASTEMSAETGDAERIQASQFDALEKLNEALSLLDDRDEQQKQDQGSQSNKSEEKGQDNNDSNQALLQRIRDMEAQRRKNRNRVPFAEQVEKDW